MRLNIEEDFALLLTAAIDVKGMPKAYPSVADEREKDYLRSLSYYIKNHPHIRKIVFVENSGWSLENIKKIALDNPYQKELEFVSLNCNDFPREFGKGYGESLLIERGIEASQLIRDVNYIGKITGRIYLFNITKILEVIEDRYDCLCDYKDLTWRIRKALGKDASPYSDTRFLVFNKKFYAGYLKDLHQQHEQGCFYFETQYYQAIQRAKQDLKVIDRFLIEPQFRGIAGHFGGKDYGSKPEQIKYLIRSVIRQVLPWAHL